MQKPPTKSGASPAVGVISDSTPSQLVSRPKKVPIPEHGLVAFESRHTSGFHGDLREPFAKFVLTIAGRARWELNGRFYSVGPDQLLHLSAGIPHSTKDLPNQPVSNYVIHYRPELLHEELQGRLLEIGLLPLDLGSPRLNQAAIIRSCFREMLFEQDARQAGWERLLHSRLIDLAVRTVRMAERHVAVKTPAFEAGSDSAERVAYYALTLKSRFYRQETLDEAARAVNLSRRQFTEIFRRVTGQSWCRHIQMLRLEHAAKLLTSTERSVTAAAFESGFEDLSHFHHSFKRAYGCTPLCYREQREAKSREKTARRGDDRPAGEGRVVRRHLYEHAVGRAVEHVAVSARLKVATVAEAARA